jgi:hypothetical protein
MLKKVDKGQPFVPSTRFHNKVADAVNSMNGFHAGAIKSGAPKHEISIPFLNTLDEDIPAGAPAVIDDYNEDKDIFTVRKFKSGDIFFGAVKNAVKTGEQGTLILCGVVKISTKGDSTRRAVYPEMESWEWVLSDYGSPILSQVENGRIVLVGATVNELTMENQGRPFFLSYDIANNKINITGGWLIANGKAIEVKADSLGVLHGTVCLTAENKNGEYGNATFCYGTFASNSIPLGRVYLDNGIINIVNFYVSTAVMIETEPHPPCDCVDGGL